MKSIAFCPKSNESITPVVPTIDPNIINRMSPNIMPKDMNMTPIEGRVSKPVGINENTNASRVSKKIIVPSTEVPARLSMI